MQTHPCPRPNTLARTLPLTLVATALMAASLLPALAQKSSGGAAALYDDYYGPVDPLPNDCNFSGHIIDGVPRTRPVFQKPNPLAISVASAQVVPFVPLPLGYRQVAFNYSFSRLKLIFPPIYSGVFAVESVRTIVHMGPNSGYPVASDQTVTGTDHVSFVNSVTQRLTSGTGAAAINNTWLVRNITTGKWRSEPYMPLTPAQVNMDCVLTVKPASTPAAQ